MTFKTDEHGCAAHEWPEHDWPGMPEVSLSAECRRCGLALLTTGNKAPCAPGGDDEEADAKAP